VDDDAFGDSDVRVGIDALRMTADELEVPAAIKDAEAWRQMGRRLRKLSPVLYQHFFAVMLSAISDDDNENIHKSYHDC
jgi:hypothetical protein